MSEILLLIIAAGVVWRLYLWSRAPHDAPTKSVALCLLSAGLSYPVAMPGGTTGIDTVAGHGTAKLIQNVLLLLTVYYLMCFYLYSADGPAARRRARREAVVVAVVVVVIILAVVSEHDSLAGSFSTADMTIPQVAAFYACAGLYLMYALGTAARWSIRYARMSGRPHSTGLWMTAVGLGAMAVACAVRAVFVAIRWSGGSVPHELTTSVAAGLVVSSLLFVAGITYSGVRARITATRLWLRRRRDHRRLTPLWQLLIEVYPENELRPASRRLWDRWRARGVHRRYHRRIVECRDGLVDISPYLVSGEGASLLDLEPPQLAQRLRVAVTMIKNGSPAPGQAVALAVPQDDDQQADVRQLIAVSEALRLTA